MSAPTALVPIRVPAKGIRSCDPHELRAYLTQPIHPDAVITGIQVSGETVAAIVALPEQLELELPLAA